jgi:hypothetical protein
MKLQFQYTQSIKLLHSDVIHNHAKMMYDIVFLENYS